MHYFPLMLILIKIYLRQILTFILFLKQDFTTFAKHNFTVVT